MTGHCTCGRPVYFERRINAYVHVHILPEREWHAVDLAPSAARALHPAGAR